TTEIYTLSLHDALPISGSLRSPDRDRRSVRPMKSDDTRTCLVCGTQFPRSKEFCPICILREAMDEQIKPAKKLLKGVLPNRSGRPLSHQFEHYELITDQDGKPV